MTTLSSRLLPLALSAALVTSLAPAATSVPAPDRATWGAQWHTSVVDADQNLRGLDGVSAREAWATGESRTGGAGRIFHTTDRGATWQDVTPPGTEGLSFRDVEAERGAVHVLAIGPGESSRIYRTTDGGETWTESFRNTDPAAFYDCMAFYPGGRRGLAVSDPVDGKFRILATRDAGRTWQVLPDEGMVPSEGEGAFAASGDCLTISGGTARIISGGAQSRVISSRDGGHTWTATDSGVPAGPAAGAFAGSFVGRSGIVVGGDFEDAADTEQTTAWTRGGRPLRNGEDLTHVGEDVDHVRGTRVALATGTYQGSEGTSLTRDGGRTWTRISDQGFHAVDCTVGGTCWGAGATGEVGRMPRFR